MEDRNQRRVKERDLKSKKREVHKQRAIFDTRSNLDTRILGTEHLILGIQNYKIFF
jgi:hypothetical protein